MCALYYVEKHVTWAWCPPFMNYCNKRITKKKLFNDKQFFKIKSNSINPLKTTPEYTLWEMCDVAKSVRLQRVKLPVIFSLF